MEGKPDEKCHNKALKVATYIVVFSLVLIFAVVSKGALLISVSSFKSRHYPSSAVSANTFHLRCLNYSDEYTITTGNVLRIVKDSLSMCIVVPLNYTDALNCLSPPPNTSTHRYAPHNYFTGVGYAGIRLLWGWSIFFMIVTPYAFVSIRCVWTILFKSEKNPTLRALMTVLVTETCHAVGLSLLMFYVLPSMNDAFQSLMLMCGVAIIPSLILVISEFLRLWKKIAIFSKVVCRSVCCIWGGGVSMSGNENGIDVENGKSMESSDILVGKSIVSNIFNIAAFLAQLSAGVYIIYSQPSGDLHLQITTFISLLLVSIRWWDNFAISRNRNEESYLMEPLTDLVKDIHKSRTKTQLATSLLKMLVTFLMFVGCITWQTNTIDPVNRGNWRWTDIFNLSSVKSDLNLNGIWDVGTHAMEGTAQTCIWILLVHILSSLACYYCARFAARIKIQRVSYALPLLLSTPATIILFLTGCKTWSDQPCAFQDVPFADHHFFHKCPPKDDLQGVWIDEFWFILPVYWLSLMWTAKHVWSPRSERLAKTDKIFKLPLYDGVLVGESLLLNRNRNDKDPTKSVSNVGKPPQTVPDPFVYICATMWHETTDEMKQMLNSIFRLDRHQTTQKSESPDYYKFEAHIFFDDSMKDNMVNKYVRKLIKSIDEALRKNVSGAEPAEPPEKNIYRTPYGGRLEWTLPGQNILVVHLKDKSLIKHKKRWSQVMYMNYFLDYKLSSPSAGELRTNAENTFLLALDGDVDFKPKALILLIDLMKRSQKVGAVCGRIHPIGSGPMVWYQEFEYALGHWMQKATEHVIGCVLCSPGCFSLFRGSVLRDEHKGESIKEKYSTESKQASHLIQYDQGEDRWLCTLILQQGYRIEYCAASDSYTNAPEGFDEFFNQRRRWMPSTMANVIDLLQSWKHTTSVNENISFLYIFYQGALLVASLLSPGVIFMMMVGALHAAMKNWTDHLNIWGSSILNFVPVFIFVVLCYKATSKVQLCFAWILCGLYILVQFIVLVGTVVTMTENNLCHPTTLFFLLVAGVFILSAILHPKEFTNLFKGFTYYLAIPTMYMTLMIYSMCNLHDVSWGTREGSTNQNGENGAKKAETDVLSSIKIHTSSAVDRALRCSGCCTFNCCSQPIELNELTTNVMKLSEKVDEMRQLTTASTEPEPAPEAMLTDTEGASATAASEVIVASKTDDAPAITASSNGNEWTTDSRLGSGNIVQLPGEETIFFEKLIEKCLKPSSKTEEKEKKLKKDLLKLRNKMSAAFLFFNAVFVVLIFVLQLNVETVYIPWPCPDKHGGVSRIDPLGFIFLAIFGTIILIQTISMLIHRMATFGHIMASTVLCGSTNPTVNALSNTPQITAVNAIQLAAQSTTQSLTHLNNRSEPQSITQSETTMPHTIRQRATAEESSVCNTPDSNGDMDEKHRSENPRDPHLLSSEGQPTPHKATVEMTDAEGGHDNKGFNDELDDRVENKSNIT